MSAWVEVVVRIRPEELAGIQRYTGLRNWSPAIVIGSALERELERWGLLRFDPAACAFVPVEGPTCPHGNLLSAVARCIEEGRLPSYYSTPAGES